jgi:hypothetical protein
MTRPHWLLRHLADLGPGLIGFAIVTAFQNPEIDKEDICMTLPGGWPEGSNMPRMVVVTALGCREVLGNHGQNIGMVLKELCNGQAEVLGDAVEAARWWRYNLV